MRFFRARSLCGTSALVLLAAAASCSDNLSLGPEIEPLVTPDSGPPPADAAPYYDVAACKACIATSCTAERVRCFSVAGCVAIANCIARPNCNQECTFRCNIGQTTFGRREYQALSTCEFEASCGGCRDVCGASPVCVLRSSPSVAPPPTVPVTCGTCTRERCADAVTKCEPGSACAAYFACTNPCPEPRAKCVEVCNTNHAQGRAEAEALVACSSTACKGTCSY